MGEQFNSYNEMETGMIVACKQCLELVHKQGVLHGDVRPANFIITSRDSAVLIDFGRSKRNASKEARRKEMQDFEKDICYDYEKSKNIFIYFN